MVQNVAALPNYPHSPELLFALYENLCKRKKKEIERERKKEKGASKLVS